MEIPLKSITHAVNGGLAHGLRTTIYGIDEDGMMWELDPKTREWRRIDNPRTGVGKTYPDDPGDTTPTHNDL